MKSDYFQVNFQDALSVEFWSVIKIILNCISKVFFNGVGVCFFFVLRFRKQQTSTDPGKRCVFQFVCLRFFARRRFFVTRSYEKATTWKFWRRRVKVCDVVPKPYDIVTTSWGFDGFLHNINSLWSQLFQHIWRISETLQTIIANVPSAIFSEIASFVDLFSILSYLWNIRKNHRKIYAEFY